MKKNEQLLFNFLQIINNKNCNFFKKQFIILTRSTLKFKKKSPAEKLKISTFCLHIIWEIYGSIYIKTKANEHNFLKFECCITLIISSFIFYINKFVLKNFYQSF